MPVVITLKQLKQYWRVINEETLASKSDIHFGHYIMGYTLDVISHYRASRVTVVIQAHGIQLDR